MRHRTQGHGQLFLVTALAAVAALLFGGLTAQAAVPPNAPAHTGKGPVIDTLAVGDSYMAGNGGGSYYNASPDDPAPLTNEYAGQRCYRSYKNASYLAFEALGGVVDKKLVPSSGRYINRACSSKLTTDVTPSTAGAASEIDGLPDSEIGRSIDLILYSAGGNDALFPDIVRHCFVGPYVSKDLIVDGQFNGVSKRCIGLLDNLDRSMAGVRDLEEGNITDLLKRFQAAHVVVDGYPLLATPIANDGQYTDTWNYAATRLRVSESYFASLQNAMVSRVNETYQGRVAFNNVYGLFEADGGHAMGSTDPWINGPQDLPEWYEGAHPNAAGQQAIANGIAWTVANAGWFTEYPADNTKADYTYIPGNGDLSPAPAIADSHGALVPAIAGLSGQLDHCLGHSLHLMGWVGATSGALTFVDNGPDTINIECTNPRPGDLVNFGESAYRAVASAQASPFAGTMLQPVPTGWMYNCLARRDGARKLRMNQFFNSIAAGNSAVEGTSDCVPKAWRNRVVSVPDGKSWLVDGVGARHWIPDSDTYFALTAKTGPGLVLFQADVDTIPRSEDQRPLLIASDFEGRIMRRNDGVSWVVLNGVRRHIPDYATDLCARYVDRRAVARTDVSAAAAESIPEGAAFTCDLEHSILRANDPGGWRPSYAFYDGERHWIADGLTFNYYTRRGWAVVDLPTEGEIKGLPDGGTEPGRLSPGQIPADSIIRRNDGVSWVVDGDRVRHHIPYAQDDVCWRDRNGYRVSATNLSGSQADSLPQGDAWPCVIGPNVIVKSDDGSSWYVDQTNTRHWVPDVETYWVLAKRATVIGPWSAGDVNQLPHGADMTRRIDRDSVKSTLMCRDDNVCWAVDANGWSHHIPTAADNVCWRWYYGWHVSRSGLTYDQAHSVPEGTPWGCTMNNRIVATNEGAAYLVISNVRHWIPDTETFYCYADRGNGTIRGMGIAEAGGIPEGGGAARCLSPNRVLNRVVRVSDGTAYFVDGAGWWHWIPDGGVWGCVTSRHPVLMYNATWEQVNSLKREGVRASCGM